MVESSKLRRCFVTVAIGLLTVLPAGAQTAVWTAGGGANTNYTDGANWSGGVAPPNDGSNTLNLNQIPDVTVPVNVNTAANVAGIVFEGSPDTLTVYSFTDGGGSLTIGSGGISSASMVDVDLYFDASVVLGANQTWNLGFVNQEGGTISGPGALTITGAAYIFGNNTFTGGVNVISGSFYVGSSASAGTGTITMSDNTSLGTFFSADSLANPVVLGNNVSLTSGATTPLTLTGPVTVTNAVTNINIGSDSQVYLAGTLGGPSDTMLTFTGDGAPVLPADGGSQLVFQGALSQVTGIAVYGAQFILAPAGDPAAALSSLSPTGLQIGNVESPGYLGLDGTFATTSGAVANFISRYGPSMGPTIVGTLGFDTVANPASPNVFSDPVDLTDFTSSYFLGLGSATSAILSGSITPTPSNTYPFGGGGGTLTVTSNLEDDDGTGLIMTAAPTPLTLIIQGANNYTGGVMSNGGVLIFDSLILPTGGISLNGGYVGYTETPGLTATQFIALFNNYGNGVVGFDQAVLNTASPRIISDNINMSYFNSDSSIFIGTSTAVELTGTITPANNQYLFTGVKGGALTVASNLPDADGTSVTIGLLNSIESNGSGSVVNLTGNNSYAGGTTFNSGSLFISSDTAFGAPTGVISVPDMASTSSAPYLASFGGSPVTVMNPMSVGSMNDGSTQGITLGNASPSGNDMLVLNGVISDYPDQVGMVAISGPVTLGAANTYSGGTIITGTGSALALVTNPTAFGTGTVNVQDDGVIAPLGANVALGNSIVLDNSPLTLGQSGNTFILTLNGAISGSGNLTIDSSVTLNGENSYSGGTVVNGANVVIGDPTALGSGPVTLEDGSTLGYSFMNPTVLDLSGDASNSVNLTSGQTLTLDADATGGNYSGAINGDGTNSVVKIDSGIQQLSGSSTYGGGTSVTAGILIAGSPSALGTGPVTVSSGAQLGVSSGTTLTLPITLSGNSTLSGSGTFSPAAPILFSGGNTVMPGTAISGQYVSALSFGTPVTFGTDGIYILNVANAGGVAGTDYSTVDVSGALTITASPGSFTVAVNSITPGGGPGPANFNASLSYSWTILTAASISAFNAADFTINTSNFQNSLGGGSFTLGESGNTLTLDFTPVPEPSTWMLLMAGLAAMGAGVRRRKRS